MEDFLCGPAVFWDSKLDSGDLKEGDGSNGGVSDGQCCEDS